MVSMTRGKNPDALRRRSAAVYRRLRCAACLLSRKDCSVMKKINSTNNAEQPRPPAFNVKVALLAFGDRRELLHEGAKLRPRVAHFAFEITLSQAITLTLLLVCSFSPRKYKSILRGI